ncbi:cyclin-Y-like protein 1 [Saccopteryx leptura]|uniref:cyclin-Y-like protein 1 n=1 Tax=Saccopteryx leptura TaxID=249018 RepID=UPI00339BDAC2
METYDSVSKAIYDLIKDRLADRSMDIFDERFYPLTKEKFPLDYFKKDPRCFDIEMFVCLVFCAMLLTAECAIYTAVLLKRLVTSAEINICPKNWRRLVGAAAYLACKVSGDQNALDMNYVQETVGISIKDMLFPDCAKRKICTKMF